MTKIKTEDLQKYAIYLRKYLPKDKGRIHTQLTQFAEQNRINGILYPNSRQENKKETLEWLKDEIELYANSNNKSLILETFEEYNGKH